MSIELQRKMSSCQQLQQEFMLLFILFVSVWCTTNSKIDCPYKTGAEYIDGETEGKDITYGDCSFENTLCNYTQACTNGTAKNWTVLDGRAVCLGSGGEIDSFSVLLSPLLNITHNTSLVFNYSRSDAAKLSVFVATCTEITEVFPDQTDDRSPQPSVYINPSLVKIGFKARRADVGSNVTLSHVKLQAAPFTDLTTPSVYSRIFTWQFSVLVNDDSYITKIRTGCSKLDSHVTTIGTSSTSSQSVSSSTTQAEAEKQEVRSNVGIIAGVLVALVVVVVAGVTTVFFIWKCRKQQQNRNSEQETVKGELNIYQSADVGVTTAATIMPSTNKCLTNLTVKSIIDGIKPVPGIMGSSSNQYDVPRNGPPVGRREDEQSRLPELTSPFVDDCEEDGYNILEEVSAMGASQERSVYSYAIISEGATTPSSNNPDGHYDKTDASKGTSLWHRDISSGAVDDDYNHISTAGRAKEKARNFEENKELTSPYSLAKGRQDNDCSENTQPSGVNGQRSESHRGI